MDGFIDSFFNREVLLNAWPAVTAGFWVTLKLTTLIVPTGIIFGLVLALIRSLRSKVLNFLIITFVDSFRAIPPLVILILFFFALPFIQIQLSGQTTAWLGLSFVLAAFSEEIFWATMLAIPKGQWEAARVTGLNQVQALRYVVLPQAIRIAIPPLTNRAIAIGKGTALASVIAVPEVLNQATSIQAQFANPSPLVLAAGAYLVLFFPFVIGSRFLESRYRWKR